MKRKLSLPKHLEGTVIERCYDCPFYDFGDTGYGHHCNLVEQYTPHSPTIEWCPFLTEVSELGEKSE